MSIQSYKFYKIYSAVNLHFTSSYDIFKYKGKTRTISGDAFDKRSDKSRFSYFAKFINSDKHALQFCVFNFLYNTDWLYKDYASANDKYFEKNKFYSTFTRNITNDFDTIESIRKNKDVSFESLFEETRTGNPPPILQLLWKNDISIEFVCLCDATYHLFEQLKNSKDPLVKEEVRKICKYSPFVVSFRK